MDTPLINGVSYSWGNIKIVLFGVMVRGITGIEYTRKQKKENQYGQGTEPVSRGYGNVEYEGSIEIYTEELKRIIDAAPGRDPLKIPPFDIQVVFGTSLGATQNDILKSCEFTEEGLKGAQGDTSFKVKIPLIIGAITR